MNITIFLLAMRQRSLCVCANRTCQGKRSQDFRPSQRLRPPEFDFLVRTLHGDHFFLSSYAGLAVAVLKQPGTASQSA